MNLPTAIELAIAVVCFAVVLQALYLITTSRGDK